jgi:hypothetical protein
MPAVSTRKASVFKLPMQPATARESAGLDQGSFGQLCLRIFSLLGCFVTLVTIVGAFSRVKDFAIDVLMWRDLNHRRAVRRPNVRLAHCLTSLRFAGSLRPRPLSAIPQKEAGAA